jgi:hypothetical protein
MPSLRIGIGGVYVIASSGASGSRDGLYQAGRRWDGRSAMTDETPLLREFGYQSLTQNGRLAAGSRPLIVVLAEYDVDDSGRFGTFASAHPVEYYERLALATTG